MVALFGFLRKFAMIRYRRAMDVDGGDEARYRQHAEICKVLTDPKRLRLLDALRRGSSSVGQLAAAAGMSVPNASQHLAVMRHAGLVETTRSGTFVHYRLSEPDLMVACDAVERIVRRRMRIPAEVM